MVHFQVFQKGGVTVKGLRQYLSKKHPFKNLRVQKNLNTEKIAFKVVQIKQCILLIKS